MPRVFISYVHEDQTTVERLAKDLRLAGITVWLDKDNILPGQFWADAIRQAIGRGDYFLACFSNAYNRRIRSYMNEELTLAIEELRQRPTHSSWFIPVLLSGEVPDRDIGAGKTLRSLQYVLMDTAHWAEGLNRILAVLKPLAAISSELLLTSMGAYSYQESIPHVVVTVIKCRQICDIFPIGSTWEQGQFVGDVSYYKTNDGYRNAMDIWQRDTLAGALCIDQFHQHYFLHTMQLRAPDNMDKVYKFIDGMRVLNGPYKLEYRLIAPDLSGEYLALKPETGKSFHFVTYR